MPIPPVLASTPAASPRLLSVDPAQRPWSDVIGAARVPERARVTVELFARRLQVDEALRPEALALVAAAGTGRDDGATEGLVTPVQALRALHALERTTGALRSQVVSLLRQAGSDFERAVLLKALGARAQVLHDHRVPGELDRVANLIRGQNLPWLLEKTTLYGTLHAPGIRQAWEHSCAPTMVLLALAEVDPLEALCINLNGVPAVDERSPAAQWQRTQLETIGGGVAVSRGALGGRGTRDDTLVRQMLGFTRATITRVDRNAGFTSALKNDVASKLAAGVDVPLRIATRTDAAGHSVIAVDVRAGPQGRELRIHDPWTGNSSWLPESTVFDGWWNPTTDTNEFRQTTHVYLTEFPERP